MLCSGTAATQSVASAAGTYRTHPNTHHQPPNVPCSVHASSVAPTQLQVQLESLRSVVQLTIVVEIVYFISLISQGRGCVRLLTFTHSTWPLSAAAYAGVQPSLASVFTSPPASSNTFTLESEGLEPGGGGLCVGQILGSSAALTTGDQCRTHSLPRAYQLLKYIGATRCRCITYGSGGVAVCAAVYAHHAWCV